MYESKTIQYTEVCIVIHSLSYTVSIHAPVAIDAFCAFSVAAGPQTYNLPPAGMPPVPGPPPGIVYCV